MATFSVSSGLAAGVHTGSGDASDFVALAGDVNGRLLSGSDFEPVDGGGQAINIGSSATRSSALTVGDTVEIKAEADCYIVAGTVAVDATTSDYFLREGETVSYLVATSKNYISVIRKATDVTGGCHICRVA